MYKSFQITLSHKVKIMNYNENFYAEIFPQSTIIISTQEDTKQSENFFFA